MQEIGDLLDDYHEQVKDDEKHGIIDIFAQLTEELMAEGFFGELMSQMTTVINKKGQKK